MSHGEGVLKSVKEVSRIIWLSGVFIWCLTVNDFVQNSQMVLLQMITELEEEHARLLSEHDELSRQLTSLGGDVTPTLRDNRSWEKKNEFSNKIHREWMPAWTY